MEYEYKFQLELQRKRCGQPPRTWFSINHSRLRFVSFSWLFYCARGKACLVYGTCWILLIFIFVSANKFIFCLTYTCSRMYYASRYRNQRRYFCIIFNLLLIYFSPFPLASFIHTTFFHRTETCSFM